MDLKLAVGRRVPLRILRKRVAIEKSERVQELVRFTTVAFFGNALHDQSVHAIADEVVARSNEHLLSRRLILEAGAPMNSGITVGKLNPLFGEQFRFVLFDQGVARG